MFRGLISFLLLGTALAGCHSRTSPKTLRQQAVTLRAAGESDTAVQLLRQAIKLQRTESRDERAAAADLRRELASWLISLDDIDPAEKLYREALALIETKPSGSVESCINLQTQLAGLCYRQGRLGESANFYHTVLSLETSSLGGDHPDVLGTLSILGGLELKLGHVDIAEQLFRRQLTGAQKFYGNGSRETAAVLENLADTLERGGKIAEAARLNAEAKQIRHKLCDAC